MRRRRPVQLSLPKHAGRGGRRKGAGRKPRGDRALITHMARPALAARFPVHVTLRVLPHVWSLRSRRSFRVLRTALTRGGDRFGMRICEFSIQGNHLHLVAEASDAGALSRGMQGLAIRIAKGLNAMMQRAGKVLADRFHSRILRTPTEVDRVVRYVRSNRAVHRTRWGQAIAEDDCDRYSSAFVGHGVALAGAKTYLLRRARGDPPHRRDNPIATH
jgi:REP element-mobilizing transposase RayT